MNLASIDAVYGIYYYMTMTVIRVDVARKSTHKSREAFFGPFFSYKQSFFGSNLFIWVKRYDEVLILSATGLIPKLLCFFELLIDKIGGDLIFKVISCNKLKFFSDFLILIDIVKGIA